MQAPFGNSGNGCKVKRVKIWLQFLLLDIFLTNLAFIKAIFAEKNKSESR